MGASRMMKHKATGPGGLRCARGAGADSIRAYATADERGAAMNGTAPLTHGDLFTGARRTS